MLSRRVVPAVAAAIAVLVVAIVVWRIRFGVDFTDEAFYLVIPLRFVLGDRPFIDDLTVAQNAGVVVYPLVNLYHRLAHGTEGIVLFARLSWLVLAALTGTVIFRCLRPRIGTAAAFLVGMISVAYIPYDLPALSYNTLGCAFFTLGIYLVLTPILDEDSDRWWILPFAGAAHALAAFSYPTLALPVIGFAALLPLHWRQRRRQRVLAYAAGGAVPALAVLPPLLRAGRAQLDQVFQYSSTGNLAGGAKITTELGNLWHAAPHPLFLAAVIAALFARRRAPLLAIPLLALVPLAAMRSTFEGLMRGNAFVVYFGALAPFFAFAVADRKLARTLAVSAIAPSLFAGVVTAWTSGNGAIAACIGMLPACVASAALLVASIIETARASGRAWLVGAASLTPAIALGALLALLCVGDVVYRDAPIPDLTARVEGGPYRGLYTTPKTRARLYAIGNDIRAFVADRPRVLFYWSFSAGYLLADRRPATCCAWIFQNGPRVGMDADCFRRFLDGRTLVVKLGSEREDDPLDRAVREHTQVLLRRDGYFIAAELPH